MPLQIFNLEPIAQHLSSNKTIVVELDAEGNIDGSLQGNSGLIRFISQTNKIGDNIFFGSPYNKYLGWLYVGVPTMEVEGKGVRMVERDEEKEPEAVKEGEPEVEEKEGISKVEEQKEEKEEEEKNIKPVEEKKVESKEETVTETIPKEEAVPVEVRPTPEEPGASTAEEAKERKEEVTTAKPTVEVKEHVEEKVSDEVKKQDSIKKEEL